MNSHANMTPKGAALSKPEIEALVRLGIQPRTLPLLIARFDKINAAASAIGSSPEALARGLKRAKSELLMMIAAHPANTVAEFEQKCLALGMLEPSEHEYGALKIMAAASIEADFDRLNTIFDGGEDDLRTAP